MEIPNKEIKDISVASSNALFEINLTNSIELLKSKTDETSIGLINILSEISEITKDDNLKAEELTKIITETGIVEILADINKNKILTTDQLDQLNNIMETLKLYKDGGKNYFVNENTGEIVLDTARIPVSKEVEAPKSKFSLAIAGGLLVVGLGIAAVTMIGGDKDTPKPEGKNGKPKTENLVASNSDTQSGSERGNETEKPASVENTHGLPFKIDTTDWSGVNPNNFMNSANPEDRIPNGIRMAKIYVAKGQYNDAGSILANQMNIGSYGYEIVGKDKNGKPLTRGNRAGDLLEMMCIDTSAKYVDINFKDGKVYINVAGKDLKSHAYGYREINSAKGKFSYDGVDKNGKPL